MTKFSLIKTNLRRYTFLNKKIKEWVEQQCIGKVVLNLFGGPTRLNTCIEVSNDIDLNMETDYHLDALDCVKLNGVYDVILLDPPYSYRKSMEIYNGHLNSRFKLVLDEIPNILTKDGKVITFGYHASVMSKCRGFKVDEILILDHSGSQHSTIVVVESRI